MRVSARAAAVLVAAFFTVFSGSGVQAAEEKSVLEVSAGLGSVSTKWSVPQSFGAPSQTYEADGGSVFRARALLTVPISARLHALIGATYSAHDRGWLGGSDGSGSRPAYFAAEKAMVGEFGFRVRL